jgi:pimeloyl-ACP methyl ester carboxylesterase
LRNLAATLRNGADPPPGQVPVDQVPHDWKKAAALVNGSARHYEGMANEFAGVRESNSQLAKTGALRATPVLIVTAGRSFYAFEQSLDTDIAAANAVWLRLQRDLLNISTEAHQIVVPNADHFLIYTHPQVVADHIAGFIGTLLER